MYYTPERRFKLFDCHARDLFGMAHPLGTCVLLELETLNELVNYFQALYTISNALFELKGVHISEIQYNTSCHRSCAPINNATICKISPTVSHEIKPNAGVLKSCCAISFYSICFSIMKACGYWDSQTLHQLQNRKLLLQRLAEF